LAQPRRMSIEDRVADLKSQLNLSDSQTVAVTNIFHEMQGGMADARDLANGDRSNMRDLMRSMREDTNAKIMAILKDDQKAKYRELLKEQRKHIPRRRN